jgi:hypothetical protein
MIERAMEVWKPLIYKNQKFPFYRISNLGRIASVSRFDIDKLGRKYFVNGKILTPRTNGVERYLFFDAMYMDKNDQKKKKSLYIHRAVYESFISINDKLYVSHKNNETLDNRLSNLYTLTHSQLQLENLKKYPQNKWRLAKANKKNNYKPLGRGQVMTENKILALRELSRRYKMKVAADMLNISLSTAYKYSK